MRYFLLPLIVFFVSSFSCTSTSPIDEGIVETKPDANVHDIHFIEEEPFSEKLPESFIEREYSNEAKHEDSKDIQPDKPIKETTPEPERDLYFYCLKITQKWDAVVKKSNDCQHDDDCVLLGFRGDCSCSYGPSDDGSPVNKKARSELEPIAKEYLTHCRERKCIQDISERRNLRCEAGRCKADFYSCLERD